MAHLGTIILAWIQKEMSMFFINLPEYLSFYRMRDRIPFFTLLFYLAPFVTKKKLVWEYLSAYFVSMAGILGLVSIYFKVRGIANTTWTGFSWNYAAPIQYSLQILIITYLAYRVTKEISFSTTLGFHAASATGYVYETPFWVFSVKDQAHFLHSHPSNLFFINYQIIAIPVFIWLLSRAEIKINRKRFNYFIYAYFLTYIIASKMYLLESALYSRIPLIVFSIYLASEIRETNISTNTQ